MLVSLIRQPKQKLSITELSKPIKSSLTKIKSFGTLTIYQMKMSKFWYMRAYINRKQVRRSTNSEDKRQAEKEAIRIYLELQQKSINNESISKSSGFVVIAEKLQTENERRVVEEQISDSKTKNDRYRLKNDLIPFFKKYQLNEIDYSILSQYFKYVNDKRQSIEESRLHTNTLKLHLSHLKQIFKHGAKLGAIQSLPVFPSFKTIDEPRTGFNKSEYTKLHSTLRNRIGHKKSIVSDKSGKLIRHVELSQELYDLIIFMTNSFIRPTDIKVMRHTHVAIVNQNNNLYLRLTHPRTKSHSQPVITLEQAVEVYKNIVTRQKKNKEYKSDGYVFMPSYDNRTYALRQLQRQFDLLLEITNLKKDTNGKDRVLYSLRHTAITFRMLEADNLDLLTLSKNARTSNEMLSRFYLKYLSPEMNVEKLQSQKNPKIKEAMTKRRKS